MTATTTERQIFEYRPHLDGLRTVAVYLVVVFHADVQRLSGGFIGVDLFFVLSGYLVTHVLISELWVSGSVSLARFYSRRARRLLPAAVVTLLATAALFTLVVSPSEARGSADSFRAAFLYYANWHFISESTNYFANDLDTNPVLHYWSLSIEEQFYIGWPVALLGLTALRRRLPNGDRLVRGVVLLTVIGSAAWAVHLSGDSISRAYYGTDTRAYQLLAGAFLAMSPALVTRRSESSVRRSEGALSAVALGSIVVLGTSAVSMNPITRGILTTIAAIAVLVFLERSSERSTVRRILSSEPATYLGRISYGTYLWHWPVIIVVNDALAIGPLVTALIAAAVATGLAAISSQLLELPIRRSTALQRIPKTIAIVGVVTSALVGVLLVPRILERDLRVGEGGGASALSDVGVGRAVAAPATARDVTIDEATLDWENAGADRAAGTNCIGGPVEKCLVIEGDGPTIVLLGDSHGVMMLPALKEIARRRNYTLLVPADYGCSWHIGLAVAEMPEQQTACMEAQSYWFDELIPAVDPALVIVIQRAVDDPARPIRMVGDTASSSGADLLRTTADRTLDRLRDLGQPVAIIESIPVTLDDPIACLSEGTDLARCRYVASVGQTPVEEHYATRAGRDDVFLVNIDAAVCPYFPICDPVVDGVVAKWDATHLTATYARAISAQLEAALDEAGALP